MLATSASLGSKVVAKYKLHCVGASGNAYKVALYLACAGLDWEPIGIDFAGGQTRDASWRDSVNAMGEIPVLQVADRRLSQSGAILMWLAETTGKFAPESSDERLEAIRWVLFDNHKFTGNFATYRFQNSIVPEPPHPAVLAFLKSRVEGAFAIVERHVSNHSFMLGDPADDCRFFVGWIHLLSTGRDRYRYRGFFSRYPCVAQARRSLAWVEAAL
jgi:glutathione S-transferase